MNSLTEDFLRLQGIYFRILGFDIFAGRRGHSWQQPWKTLWSLLALFMVQLMVIGYGIENVKNVDKLTDAMTALLVNHLSLFKFGLIIWQHKDLEELIGEFRKLLSRVSQCEAAARIIQMENQREQRFSGFYAKCFLLAGILSSLKPLMGMGLTYWRTGEFQLQMNFPCVYPWDNQQLRNFLFSCALLSAGSIGVVLPTICIDTLFNSLVHNLVALFKTAQYKIKFFQAAREEQNPAALRQIFHLYKNSLELSSKLKRFFQQLISMQLLVASLHLCFLSYTLSANFAQPQMPFYIVFTISVLVQLYIYCYCGECLKTESREFAGAIYEGPWYNETMAASPGIRRSLQISMMRAQRGSHLNGYFFETNMEVFLLIVRKAMSYFTLLRSIS